MGKTTETALELALNPSCHSAQVRLPLQQHPLPPPPPPPSWWDHVAGQKSVIAKRRTPGTRLPRYLMLSCLSFSPVKMRIIVSTLNAGLDELIYKYLGQFSGKL